MSADTLSDRELAFLRAVGGGEQARSYALRNHYSRDWAKWMSRRVRRKLGVATIQEAVRVSGVETGGLSAEERAELREAIEELRQAREELRKASSAGQRAAAREDIEEAEEDLDKLARRTGLSRSELEQAVKEKAYREHRDRQERYEKERDEAAAAEKAAKPRPAPKPKPEAEPEPEEEEAVEVPPEATHWAERPLFGRKA